MKKLMLGNEAVARGAYEAKCAFVSAYPGTPSTEITANAAKYDEMYSEWAPNEKNSLEAAAGASIAGARAMSAMKHVGLNVASDALFTVSYSGINGGLVVCVADDPGMHSSQNEQDSRHYARASKVPMLEPSSSQECKDYVKQAFEISEEFDTPVLVRLSTRISHSRGIVELCEPVEIKKRQYISDAPKYVMMPGYARPRHIVVEDRMKKLKCFAETTKLNTVEYYNKKIGFICGGTSYNYSKEAFGEDASYLKLGLTYPLPDKLLKEFASNVETCFCIEELDPFVEEYCRNLGIKLIGKERLTLIGEYTPEMIRRAVYGEPISESPYPLTEEIPGRPPVMCPGCSHRAAFTAIKQLGLNVSGDIGCYTLAATPVLSAMHIQLCMGAAIGVAHGMEKASSYLEKPIPKTVAVIGDSTFIHMGITGLINAVYNKSNITVLILDNFTTGMTGGQEHPGTGKTIKGEPTVKLDLPGLCRAIGVKRVTVIDPFDLDGMKKLLKEETEADEVSVIIAERACALIKGGTVNEAHKIDQDICTSCMQCMKIGCPGLKQRGTTVTIDDALCVGCGFCITICKPKAIMPGGGTK